MIWNKSEIDEVNMIKSLVVTAFEVMREFGVKVTVKIASSIFSWRESAVVVILMAFPEHVNISTKVFKLLFFCLMWRLYLIIYKANFITVNFM